MSDFGGGRDVMMNSVFFIEHSGNRGSHGSSRFEHASALPQLVWSIKTASNSLRQLSNK